MVTHNKVEVGLVELLNRRGKDSEPLSAFDSWRRERVDAN
jgi:hypothetical protein